MLPRAVTLTPLGSALSLTLLLAAGCGSSAEPSAPATGVPTVRYQYEPDASDASYAADTPQSATSNGASILRGSPLCHASQSGCYPDDSATAQICGVAPDGGTFDPVADNDGDLACHVQSGDAPACAPPGPGYTSASCDGPTGKMGCAAAHECVGTGQCRHYCCGGNSACAVNEFCDVQPTVVDPATKVPVCMLLSPCALFSNDACAPSEQCAVVLENGTTSCVAVGRAQEGESCESDHCGTGLLCIGTVGERRCTRLCHTATSAECAAAHTTCVGSLPLFPNAAFGVCQ